jgi:hypothetical protein
MVGSVHSNEMNGTPAIRVARAIRRDAPGDRRKDARRLLRGSRCARPALRQELGARAADRWCEPRAPLLEIPSSAPRAYRAKACGPGESGRRDGSARLHRDKKLKSGWPRLDPRANTKFSRNRGAKPDRRRWSAHRAGSRPVDESARRPIQVFASCRRKACRPGARRIPKARRLARATSRACRARRVSR